MQCNFYCKTMPANAPRIKSYVSIWIMVKLKVRGVAKTGSCSLPLSTRPRFTNLDLPTVCALLVHFAKKLSDKEYDLSCGADHPKCLDFPLGGRNYSVLLVRLWIQLASVS